MARPKSEFRKQIESLEVGQVAETTSSLGSVRQILVKLHKASKAAGLSVRFTCVKEGDAVKVSRLL